MVTLYRIEDAEGRGPFNPSTRMAKRIGFGCPGHQATGFHPTPYMDGMNIDGIKREKFAFRHAKSIALWFDDEWCERFSPWYKIVVLGVNEESIRVGMTQAVYDPAAVEWANYYPLTTRWWKLP